MTESRKMKPHLPGTDAYDLQKELFAASKALTEAKERIWYLMGRVEAMSKELHECRKTSTKKGNK